MYDIVFIRAGQAWFMLIPCFYFEQKQAPYVELRDAPFDILGGGGLD